MKRILSILTAAWFGLQPAEAQVVTPGFEAQEIIQLGNTYRQVKYLSFDIKYQYADSAAPSVIQEEITGQYKMHDGRYWGMLDSVELVQGNNYSLTVFHHDSLITVKKAQHSEDRVLQLPVLDSMFSSYIDSIRVSTVCDTMRLLKVYFKNNIGYSGYEMKYNPSTYFINSMQYYMRNVDSDSSGSGTSLIKVSMCNYSEAIVPDSYFMESRFIYRDGNFYKKPEYEDFELVIDGAL